MIKGRCECKRVQYRIDGDIRDFSHCHCSQCRRLHGAAFASFAGVRRADFSYDSGESDLKCYASSPTHGRVFCGHCGSNILVELQAEPDELYLAMGTIEGDPALPEGYHIFVDSKAPWHSINDSLFQYPAEPDED
ncbi:hypothetical protein BST95_01865 [Halioglobus japonicus]|uniref:GFA family protein n=1 Tax=Halioglobus japonicus TaxID=930805 RepID=A0AAP8MC31_9GAMM|nr:GFA family protein [Halioglobus japonicus]AQA17148.1 hypothetical protein BST95_01865 [Halioglobus japonicus]KZX58281.1 hypothetical protein A3709_02120 [Halioglobus sp. HI00S01]PLW85061.1 GFA family protein [Halioglobus japonicus]